MAAEADNLDARMEAIRIKNEELERKHKEILEDELIAKRGNAVVDLKSRKSVNEPHPYENIDLDFDVKKEDKELSVNPDYKPKNRRPLPRKDLLDEIPPDPVNFLREDCDDKGNTETSPGARQQPSNRNRNNNRNRNDRPRPEGYRNEGGSNVGDSPPRPRNQNQRPRPSPQQQHSPQDGNVPKRPTHPQQLRTERRIAPSQTEDAPSQTEDAPSQQRQSGQSPQNPNRQRRSNNRQPNKEGGDRTNITVEITDGEIRSVKLKPSEKTFGTGRVGHVRPDQKFAVDTFDPNDTGENTQDRSPNDNKSRNRAPRSRKNQKPKEFQHPTLENIVIHKTSVQDRLARIAQDNEAKATHAEPQPADNGN